MCGAKVTRNNFWEGSGFPPDPDQQGGLTPDWPFHERPYSGYSSCTLSSLKHNNNHMTLTADSTIAEVLREKPEAAETLFRFGMGCLGCALAKGETIREAAMAHGIPLSELLAALKIAEN